MGETHDKVGSSLGPGMSGSTKSWLGKGWAPPGSKGGLSMGQCMATVGSRLDLAGPGWLDLAYVDIVSGESSKNHCLISYC